MNSSAEEIETAEIRTYLKKTLESSDQYWEGHFLKPVPGRITSHYGTNRKKIGRKNPNDFHQGTDFKGDLGDPILACARGKVLMTKDYQFHGRTVLLDHGQGVASIYLHMSEFSVHEGQWVERGAILGEVGSTGLSTAPHLHWGVYVLGKAVDPLQWLEQAF